jgi:RNA polymerase sigma-70 factor (ECF subfamily)
MPPLTAWFDGRDDVAMFLTERVLATPWRVRPVGDVNGWPAVLGDQLWEGEWRPGALMILHGTADRIDWLATFVDPRLVSNWPEESKELATDR